jgi:hypothetical protein
MALIHKNVLLVEGVQEVRVIPELIEANGIDWGTKKNPIVYIRDNVGYLRSCTIQEKGLQKEQKCEKKGVVVN